MKRLALLLAVILILPMGACSQEGGDGVANYLYNGVELPDINEVWTEELKKEYPYAVLDITIGANILNWADLYLSDVPLYRAGALESYITENYPYLKSDASLIRYRYEDSKPVWSKKEEKELTAGAQLNLGSIFTWASYDVYDASDDSLWKQTTIPLPSALLGGGTWSFNGTPLPSFSSVSIDDLREYTNNTNYVIQVIKGATVEGEYLDYSLYFTSVVKNVTETAPYASLGVIYRISEDKSAWERVGTTSFANYDSCPPPIWSNVDVYYADDVEGVGGTLYLAASEPVPSKLSVSTEEVTDTAATVNFTCSDLLSAKTVYRIKAWCYPKGTDFWTAPYTWESNLFAGPNHSENVTFTGLLSGTEYEVYACIYANEQATEHNALTAFTTAAGESETPVLLLTANQVTGNGFTLFITTQNLEDDTPYTAEVLVYEPDSSRVVFEDELTITGKGIGLGGINWVYVTGLAPETEYAVSVDIYPAGGEVILHGDLTVTTTDEVPVVLRDSFPLGFASGLCGVPITEADADYNTWAQGHIVGVAMRKAL